MSIKIMLMGEGDCGKGTFSHFVSTEYGLKCRSSSYHACELFMFEKLKKQYGYDTPLECYNDRRNHRAEWYEGIYAFNKNHLTALAESLFSQFDIYDGVRHKLEFEAIKKANLFDLSIWISAGERTNGESSDSISVTKEMADIIIMNNGTEDEFLSKIRRLFDHLLI